MSLLKVNFDELYRRHLCRHSQFGINVLHLIAVVGIYIALYGIAFALPGSPWIVGSCLAVYFLLLAFNLPFRLLLVNSIVIGSLLAGFTLLPEVPVWVHVVLIVVWHRFQNWNHRVYDRQQDMSEFADKYRKGSALFVLLSIYELPILLNFLVFDRKSGTA